MNILSLGFLQVGFRKLIFFSLVSILLMSCKKLVEVSAPSTSFNADNVYGSDGTAISVLTGVYTSMSNGSLTIPGEMRTLDLFASIYIDDVIFQQALSTNQGYIDFYINNLSSAVNGGQYWTVAYRYIFTCNQAYEQLTASKTITPSIKLQLLGESRFFRAFNYYYLVNLYGDIPWVSTTDFVVNSRIAKTPQQTILNNIISDLVEAKNDLSTKYLDGSLLNVVSTRYRLTTYAASALLTKVYLMQKSWDKAESEASTLIGNSQTFSLESFANVFLATSNEAIWQLQSVSSTQWTPNGPLFILPTSGPSSTNPFFLTSSFLNTFESNDLRKKNWINSVTAQGKSYFFPFKYKAKSGTPAPTESYTFFRLADVILNRAEARAQQGKLDLALADLNLVRARAGLPNVTGVNQNELLDTILHERRVEMFTEGGSRFFDLKRFNKIDQVMPAISAGKGGTWASYKSLFPISSVEVARNTLLTQNPGY
ncbi:putative outer membrane starch-binding protein [Chitinophaga dinghuensis]|uniref:Putative outer membrane starch-binding protein n=1 Tax=Chitinophaga dinghuensis TaxID=1539050 RepID=A0A327W160_9BACT|nr:RagB/SusD family nutrient uptake outer membrane protein [Chitinophaga dinghuensis]RAJ81986.1 putative outer membrane starch-binding protein [Chitinophaga dinghuensis]